MTAPLRFQYTVELNLQNEHSKHFSVASLFEDVSYTLFSSELFKSDKDCIEEVESVGEKALTFLKRQEPKSHFKIHKLFNPDFYTKVETDKNVEFEADELFKLEISDDVEKELVAQLVVQITELDIGDSLHYSDEIH